MHHRNLNQVTKLFCLVLLGMAAGCVPSPDTRRTEAERLVSAHGWHQQTVPSGPFSLAVFLPQSIGPEKTIHVYIEGDGAAWLDSATPSANPTPRTPIGLQLALQHGVGAAAIARPCQYVRDDPACASNRWWTSHRFAPEVVAATSHAVDAVKQAYGAQRVVLVGYSGGGAVAALVAAQRRDVAGLITLAGNLDSAAWVRHHGVQPLHGSLNPADAWAALQGVPQWHLVGAEDRVVPLPIAQSYAAHFPLAHRPRISVVPGQDHGAGWVARYAPLAANEKLAR